MHANPHIREYIFINRHYLQASRLLLGPLAFGLPGGYVSPTVAFAVAAVLLAMFAVGGAAEGGAQMLVPVALCVWLLLGMLALMAAY